MKMSMRAILRGSISVFGLVVLSTHGAALAETRSCVDPSNPTATGTGSQTVPADQTSPGTWMPSPMIQVPDGMGGFTWVPGPLVYVPGPMISANATVCGSGASALANSSVAIGRNAYVGSLATNSLAIGANASSNGANSVALGNGSIADASYTVSVGSFSQQRRITFVAAGTQATDAVNLAQMNAAIAANAGTNEFVKINSVAGATANATGSDAIAVGSVAVAEGNFSLAVGRGAIATQDGTIAMGPTSRARAANGVAIGALR